MAPQATAVAICDEYAVAATSKRLLRVFSFSGMEKNVLVLPGPVVCMHGLGALLGVVYHHPSSPSPEGDQVLEFQLMDLKGNRVTAKDYVGLSPKATIEWFQVVRPGLVAAMDSEGVVMIHTPAEMGGQWTPVLDIKTCNQPRDWFWPISIDDFHLTGVVCKEEKRSVPANEEERISERGSTAFLHDRLMVEEPPRMCIFNSAAALALGVFGVA